MGEARYWLGEYRSATEALNRAVTLAEEHDDLFALALALRFLGDIAINFEADVDKAEKLLDRSLQAAEQLGEPWAIVRTLLFAGWVPWTREKYQEAEVIWRRALDMVDPKDHWSRVRALTALSINHSQMNDHEGALKLIDEAGALAAEASDQFTIANTAVQKVACWTTSNVARNLCPGSTAEWRSFPSLELAGARGRQGGTRHREAGAGPA